MPKVVLPGGKTKHYPYTKAGKAAAAQAKKLRAKYVPPRRKGGKPRRRKA